MLGFDLFMPFMTIIFLYVYVVLPIAGRLLTDSLLSLLL